MSEKNITRNDISEYLFNNFGFSKLDCDKFVEIIIEEIINGLIADQIVKIHNFGTFKIKEKKERIGRNPKTKSEAIISARKVISFKPCNTLKKKISSSVEKNNE